jgi:NAD(P)-dependent dehydrogenase (short-subunit alcohol dehydrogenase family)
MNGTTNELHKPLAGQVAFVTGGGRGLGRAFAVALAAAGAAVAVVARSADQVAETVTQISVAGGRAIGLLADVSDRQAVAQSVSTVEQQLGPIDLLINNAGIVSPLGPLWESDPDEWWRTVEINLRSVLLCSHAVLPDMVARRRGRIINIASGAGTVAIPYGSAYVTSKTALIRLTETLALETQPHGVTIFAIHPGTVRTAMTEYLAESAPGAKWLPWMKTVFDEGKDVSVEPTLELVLRVATGEADLLSGRFIGFNDNLTELVARTDEIQQENRYVLRLPTLEGALRPLSVRITNRE